MPTQASNIIPDKAYTSYKQLLVQLKAFLSAKATEMQSTTGSNVVLQVHDRVKQEVDRFETLAATPGIVDYANAQEVDVANYDVAAEYLVLRAALNAIVNHIETAIPQDGDGYILDRQIVNGSYVYRQFTAGQLATLRGLIQAAIAEIV